MRVGVDNRLGEACDAVEEAMTDLLGDRVCLDQRQLGIDLNVHDDVQRTPDPACAYIGDVLYPWHLAGRRYNRRNNTWINGIQETLQNTTRGGIDDSQDNDRDHQARNRVCDAQT